MEGLREALTRTGHGQLMRRAGRSGLAENGLIALNC